MKNRHWWSPQEENSTHATHSVDRCDDVAYLLTALFDGEATEEEARRARLHLLACQRCAEVFAQWNQTRNILRDEAMPAPPPTMLWRILLAVRLSGYKRYQQPTKSAAAPAPAKPVSAVDDLVSPPPPPSHLKDAILMSTLGHGETVKPKAQKSKWAPKSRTWSAMAAPALAVCVMAFAWSQGTVTPELPQRIVAEGEVVSRPAQPSKVVMRAEVRRESAREANADKAETPVRVVRAPKVAEDKPEILVARSEPAERETEFFGLTESEPEIRRARSVREARLPENESREVEPEIAPRASTPRVVLASMRTEVSADEVRRESQPVVRKAPAPRSTPFRFTSLTTKAEDEDAPSGIAFRPMPATAIMKVARASGTMRASTPVEPVATPLAIAASSETDQGLDDVTNTVEDLRALFASDSTDLDSTELPG